MQLVICITTGALWCSPFPCSVEDSMALQICSFASVVSPLTQGLDDATRSQNNRRPVAITLPSQKTQVLHRSNLWLRYSSKQDTSCASVGNSPEKVDEAPDIRPASESISSLVALAASNRDLSVELCRLRANVKKNHE
jgi:hypothetical protein